MYLQLIFYQEDEEADSAEVGKFALVCDFPYFSIFGLVSIFFFFFSNEIS